MFGGGRSVTDTAITAGARVGWRYAGRQWRRHVSIGEVLAAARRQAGLTVTQVSQRTRITETMIIAIEGDDHAACGGDFYARGHIRSIASAVGIDPEPLLQEYDSARLGPPAAWEYVTEPITPVRRRQRRRRPPFWALALAAALVAALGSAGYLLALPGDSIAPNAGAPRATPRHAGESGHPAQPSPRVTQSPRSASAPAATPAAAPRILSPASAAAFGFPGNQGDHADLARLAIDRNRSTAWHTAWYTTAQFGNLYPGTGLLMDMGRPVTIDAVLVKLDRAPGAGLQLRVGSAPALSSLRPVAHAADAGGVVHLRCSQPAHGRYVLIWFTSLPPDPAGTFRESVYGLQVEGRT